MKQTVIKATVRLKKSLWIALFERTDIKGYAVARTVFGDEPTDPELYDYISSFFYQLKFTEPQTFKLIVKRKNYKRMQREVRKEMEIAKLKLSKSTQAQDTLRLEVEKNKKLKKSFSKVEKELQLQQQFLFRQVKKKKKKRGH
jgi:hypothetical protein